MGKLLNEAAALRSAKEALESEVTSLKTRLEDSVSRDDLVAQKNSNRELESVLLLEKRKREDAERDLESMKTSLSPSAPSFEPSGLMRSFVGAVSVRIRGECCSDTIFCTMDGSEPSPTNFQAMGMSPLTVTLMEALTLKAMLRTKIGLMSPTKIEAYVVDKNSYGSPSSMAGVGLLVEQEEGAEDVIVSKVTEGGAAAKDGRIRVGDKLISVDGRSIAGMQMPQIFKIVSGPVGSSVTLQLQRATNQGAERVDRDLPHIFDSDYEYSVSLQRCVPEALHAGSQQSSPSVNNTWKTSPLLQPASSHSDTAFFGISSPPLRFCLVVFVFISFIKGHSALSFPFITP